MSVRWATSETGDLYDVPRRPGDDDSLTVSMTKGLGLLLLLVPWYALRHPGTTILVAGSVWLLTALGPGAPLATYAALVVLLTVWRLAHPGSFTRLVANPFRSRVRGGWVYRRRWQHCMHLCGLTAGFGSDRYAPHIVRVRSDRHADRVRVKLLPGQTAEEVADRAEGLASTFGALDCRVTTAKPGVVWLGFTRRDPLTEIVPPLEPAEPVDLAALPIGITETGETWRLRLLGTHVLVAGGTGAGKGSVVWSAIRAVAPAIRNARVQAWVADPKGGMELAPGAALFTRFTHEPESMVAMVEDAAHLVRDRADRLRGVTRLHTPTAAEPLVVLVVDEIAYLSAYLPDRELTKRFSSALSVVLSQGRAVGVSVLAAVQDPRKEIVALRDLFPTRIALRLTEASQVRLVLGGDTRERGARCDHIPETMPGVGYMLLDGQREPTRVRAAYLSDDDITTMAATYQPVRTDHALTVPVITGEVVA